MRRQSRGVSALARNDVRKTRRPPGIERPDGLAEVVPTTRVGSLRPRRPQYSEIFITNKLTLQASQRFSQLFRCCTAAIAPHQLRLVSSKLPRLRIAICATSANRC